MNKSRITIALKKELKNKTILVSGGAGSICSVLVKRLLEYPVGSIRVLDIDEHALFKLKRELHDSRLRLLLGNVLDKERCERAFQGVDIVIHAAAVKNIEITSTDFEKLVENLILIYRFARGGETFHVLKNDCVTFLYETLYKFDNSKGTKAFSYFSVIKS